MKILFVGLFIMITSAIGNPSYVAKCQLLNITDHYTDEVNTKYAKNSQYDLTLIFNDGKGTGNMDDTITVVPKKGEKLEAHIVSPRGYVDIFFPIKKPNTKDPFTYGLLPNGDLVMISPLIKMKYQCKKLDKN
ncbi:hypothetical protein [Sulfurimonas sp. HSL3-7]|uniref:hypothetical protein n=1 Tax=Sulfonitrofixus jiaomeiensis TaxID=3131938 RepID=UPI0031F7CD34